MPKTYRGYKATNFDYMPSCGQLRKPYQVGRTYRMKAVPAICHKGYHFCRCLAHCFRYYYVTYETRAFEAVSTGDVAFGGDKMCTNRIKLVRELSPAEIVDKLSWRRPANDEIRELVYTLWMVKDNTSLEPERRARCAEFIRALLAHKQRRSIKAALELAEFDDTDLHEMLNELRQEKGND